MPEFWIYCAHIGSVAGGRFGWAGVRSDPSREALRTGDSIRKLAEQVASVLNAGSRVALGFECPLFVPYPEDPNRLTSARPGEGARAWCAGAGAGSLATGLTETIWLLGAIRALLDAPVPASLTWESFLTARPGLFLWEAFVSQTGERLTHVDAAERAVRHFAAALPNLEDANAVRCHRVHSLIRAALLRTGWTSDVTVLSRPCVVLKPDGTGARTETLTSAPDARREGRDTNVWDRVRALEGKTLQTLAQGRLFSIIRVSPERVEFVPERGSGNLRWFSREGIEFIANLGLSRDDIRPRILREWPSDQNSSYVAAIVHEVTKSDRTSE